MAACVRKMRRRIAWPTLRCPSSHAHPLAPSNTSSLSSPCAALKLAPQQEFERCIPLVRQATALAEMLPALRQRPREQQPWHGTGVGKRLRRDRGSGHSTGGLCLRLQHNGISARALGLLVKGIAPPAASRLGDDRAARARPLVVLELADNPLGDQGATALADAFRSERQQPTGRRDSPFLVHLRALGLCGQCWFAPTILLKVSCGVAACASPDARAGGADTDAPVRDFSSVCFPSRHHPLRPPVASSSAPRPLPPAPPLPSLPAHTRSLLAVDPAAGTELGCAGIKRIAAALDGNSALAALDLSDNDLNADAAAHLATALRDRCRSPPFDVSFRFSLDSEEARNVLCVHAPARAPVLPL